MYRQLFFGLCLMVWALAAQAQTLDIRYFHGKQRCTTCMNIEKYTLELLQEQYATQLKNGSIKMSIIDFSTAEGKKLADQQKVSFSSLFLVKNGKDKKPTTVNLTRMSFQYAKNNPKEFKRLLKEEIDKLLK